MQKKKKRKWLNSGLTIQIWTAFLSVDRGWKANSDFLQKDSKQSTASYAQLSPQIYMASVAWCGIGCQEVNLPSLTEKSHWRLQPLYWPNQPSGKTWANHYIQVANRTLWPASAPEANWHHGLCILRLQRSGTDDPPHPPGLSHLVETETPVMAAGWVNHQQAVGNGGRPALHHPVPGNMWTEGLSTADRPQKKKKNLPSHSVTAY